MGTILTHDEALLIGREILKLREENERLKRDHHKARKEIQSLRERLKDSGSPHLCPVCRSS